MVISSLMKRTHFVVIAIVVISAFWAAVFVWSNEKERQDFPQKKELSQEMERKNTQQSGGSVTNILVYKDLDVLQWTAIETEFFSAKFPREFSWIRPDKDPFPFAFITNNPRFVAKWFMSSDNVDVEKNEIAVLFYPGLVFQGVDTTEKSEAQVIREFFEEKNKEAQEKGLSCQVLTDNPILRCESETGFGLRIRYYVADKEYVVMLDAYIGDKDRRIVDIIDRVAKEVRISR